DRRLKSSIRYLPPGQLDNIMRLKPVSFIMKDDAKQQRELGLIAQDVEPVFPELVGTGDSNGMRSMNYIGLLSPMIAAMQEQQAEIERLRQENAALSRRMDALEGKIRPPLRPYNP
ncbi:MAG: tail fiber domain-containing protein, partial [Nitrospiraceae bacterium]